MNPQRERQAVPPEVLELIERFKRNLDAYESGHYKETQLRREFIDPLFKALGWDIDNTAGHAEAYKDVVHEDAVRIGAHVKAPDYSFRVGGTRKFFVEAKKPSVDIKGDSSASYQLRRYAWSAKLPLSILTDFAEFAVYDCRIRPYKTDKSTASRIQYFKFTDLPKVWPDLYALFSKQAVLDGAFDLFSRDDRQKKGTTEVDSAFLEEIEGWRARLAANIAQNNRITATDINFAVQRIIDRVIFLRICEDRGIEQYGQFRDLSQKKDIYEKLKDSFFRADRIYNSGLFHFSAEKDRAEAPDKITPKLHIDDKVLADIFGSLYYPDSPYEFSVLSADILGQVYEGFLGKVIRLTDSGRAVIDEKPEVRKSGGVYYTPQHIVEYIVKNTLGAQLSNATLNSASRLKVVDPSCGSGSFLIGAFQFLLEWHRDQYVARGPQKHRKELYQGKSGEWRLTSTEKRRILTNHIYGVDIDSQAVEVTKLSLLLKVLEGESEETLKQQYQLFQERALPDLGKNIKCGNSLVSFSGNSSIQGNLIRDSNDLSLNPFDWEAEFPAIMRTGGFDTVIGNPPYDVLEKDREQASWPHDLFAAFAKNSPMYTDALGGKLNLYRFFVVRSLALTKPSGRIGLIIPLSLLADISCAATRRHLVSWTDSLLADCFPQKDNANRRVFRAAKLSTFIFTASKTARPSLKKRLHVRTFPWDSLRDSPKECTMEYGDLALLDPENSPVPLLTEADWVICKKIYRTPSISMLGKQNFIELSRGEINQTVYGTYISTNSVLSRMVKGAEVNPFHLKLEPKQGVKEYFDEVAHNKHHAPKEAANYERIATQRITGVDDSNRIIATRIKPRAYFADSLNSIVIRDDKQCDIEYLLALLNSRLFQWRFRLTSTNNNVGTNELACLPFRKITDDDYASQKVIPQILNGVRLLESLYSKRLLENSPSSSEAIDRQIASIRSQIDDAIFRLYGISNEEKLHILGTLAAKKASADGIS